MKIVKKIIFLISFFISNDNFSSLPLKTGTLSQPKKNTILGSVQGKASSENKPSYMQPTDSLAKAKTILPMPTISDTSAKTTFNSQKKEDNKEEDTKKDIANESEKNISIVKKSEPELTVEKNKDEDKKVESASSDDSKKHHPKQIEMKDEQQEVVHEPGVLYQKPQLLEDKATIAFNFEEASLSNLLSYIENIFDIKFISEDIIAGAKDAKGAPIVKASVDGRKINFRTNKNLTYKEAWDLFVTFMHISGFNVIPMPSDRFYRVVPIAKTITDTLPIYAGVDPDLLPDSDMFIRYIYFAKNLTDFSKIQPLLKTMQSGSGKLDVYNDLRAMIFTDRSSSIKSLMKIVTELDNGMLPEVVSVVKLKRANVEDVKKLYNALKPAGATVTEQGGVKIWTMPKKESSLEYFPTEISLVEEPRTNSLIILGTARDVKRVEEFITKYIDIEIDRKAPPVFTYRLEYTNATDIKSVLDKIITYGSSNPGQQYGGVRDGIKFFQKMNIVTDSHTNSLIINSTPEDFETLKPLIKELDVPQKQIGIEVLIVQVKDADIKTLGSQISNPNGFNSPLVEQPDVNPYGPAFLPGASAQTSGVPNGSSGTQVVATKGETGQDDYSIKSSLASLLGVGVPNSVNEVGSVLVTFGKPIWAIFKILKTITSTHIISNPFLVVSNNTAAQITSGQTRRLVSSEVYAGGSSGALLTKGLTPIDATLTLNITPQINKGNIINLNINVQNQTFLSSSSATDADLSPRDTKQIQTMVSVANGETLVLGGIMTESYSSTSRGVPFLENIPVFGWFFKSKQRAISRDHFMIFICPRLLDPVNDDQHVDQYSSYKLQEVQKHLDLIDESDWFATSKDPIQKAFFGSNNSSLQQLHTGDNYQRRERLDGKIDGDEFMNIKNKKKNKKKRNKKSYKKKNKVQEEPLIQPEVTSIKSKNSIAQSIKNTAKEVV